MEVHPLDLRAALDGAAVPGKDWQARAAYVFPYYPELLSSDSFCISIPSQDVGRIKTVGARRHVVSVSRVGASHSFDVCDSLLIAPTNRAYSAHEFSTWSSKVHKTADLPLDIKLETLVSVSLACFGIVLGAEPLKPISWSTWASKIEKEGDANPYQGLEERIGFVDIRAKRKEFADWVRQQGNKEKR